MGAVAPGPAGAVGGVVVVGGGVVGVVVGGGVVVVGGGVVVGVVVVEVVVVVPAGPRVVPAGAGVPAAKTRTSTSGTRAVAMTPLRLVAACRTMPLPCCAVETMG
ncbi:MAG TPA: hypothetical protein VMW94_00480, partial [Actinomycetes bacterium]|nr:hypothetical protein [Actinomycetes bacterium]